MLKRSSLHSILERVSATVPRYTSYPPANYLSSDFDFNLWQEELLSFKEQTRSCSLYFHIPFCQTLCFFCACNRVVTKNKDLVDPYLQALIREINIYGGYLKHSSIDQVHLGGGTPNYLNPKQFDVLFQALNSAFNNLSRASLSVELDPRTCTQEHLIKLAALGCKRISVGIQDFDDKVQIAVNRIQGFDRTDELFQCARQNGIATVAVDLIYGLPLQTRESFQATLSKVLQLRPQRIAVFGYAHVQSIAPGQRKFEAQDLPNSSLRLDLLIDAIETFTSAGYIYIGMDHFVLPEDPLAVAAASGTLGRSFMGYVSNRGVPVIAMGASSISITPNYLIQNAKELQSYQRVGTAESLLPDSLVVERAVRRSSLDRAAGDIIESVLSSGIVNFDEARGVHGDNSDMIVNRAMGSLRCYAEMGLLNLTSSGLQLTQSGQIFGREIASTFDYRKYLENKSSPQSLTI